MTAIRSAGFRGRFDPPITTNIEFSADQRECRRMHKCTRVTMVRRREKKVSKLERVCAYNVTRDLAASYTLSRCTNQLLHLTISLSFSVHLCLSISSLHVVVQSVMTFRRQQQQQQQQHNNGTMLLMIVCRRCRSAFRRYAFVSDARVRLALKPERQRRVVRRRIRHDACHLTFYGQGTCHPPPIATIGKRTTYPPLPSRLHGSLASL